MSYNYRLGLLVTANSGQAQAEFNRLGLGIAGMERRARGAQNAFWSWDQQTKALGTTLRYALAGSLAFAIPQAIAQLSQFERKMGDIAGLAINIGAPGAASQVVKDAGQLSDAAIQASTNLAEPVANIQQMMQTFYSSFEVPSGNTGVRDATRFVDVMTKLARIGEVTDVGQAQKLAEGTIGIANSLGRGQSDIPKMAEEIAQVVKRSVGFRGDVLASNLGRLGASFAQGGFTSEQGFGILTAASKAGGSPAVIARGIAQLTANILNPKSKTQKAAYRSIGLPTDPNLLVRLGGDEVLRRMIAGVAQRGGVGISRAGRNLSTDALDALDPNAGPGAVGVSGGGTKLAYSLFGRVESLRQFAILAKQGQPAIDRFVQEVAQAANSLGKTNDVLANQYQTALHFSQLSQAGIALSNLRLQATKNLDPLLHPVARDLTKLVKGAEAHPAITKAVEYSLIGTLVGGGLLKRAGLLQRFSGGGALRKALGVEEAPALIGGGGTAFGEIGTRANPMWVVIAQNFAGVPVSPTTPGGGPSIVGASGRFKKFGGPLGIGVGVTGAVMAGLEVAGIFGERAKSKSISRQTLDKIVSAPVKARQEGGHVIITDSKGNSWMSSGGGMYTRIASAPSSKRSPVEVFEQDRRFKALDRAGSAISSQVSAEVHGEGILPVRLELTGEAARILKMVDPKAHVSVKLFNAAAPTSGGKGKTKKRGTG